MQNEARLEAQKQWNARACGELEGDKNTVDYFLQVEKDRYGQQAWRSITLDMKNSVARRCSKSAWGRAPTSCSSPKWGRSVMGWTSPTTTWR